MVLLWILGKTLSLREKTDVLFDRLDCLLQRASCWSSPPQVVAGL